MTGLLLGLCAMLGLIFIYVGSTKRGRRQELPEIERRNVITRYLDRLRLELTEAGIDDLSPERFIVISILAGVTSGLLFSIMTGYTLVSFLLGTTIAVFGLRNLYVGRLATKRRLATIEQVAKACREIADALDVNMAPSAALESYASRARPGAASEALLGQEDQVARSLLKAIVQRDTKGAKQDIALRSVAEELGNRYFGAMVEVYIQNAESSPAQLSAALRRLATEVDFSIQLRLERQTHLSPPLTSYKLVGGVVAFLLGATQMLSPDAAKFYQDMVGQIVLVVMAGWWLLGYQLLARKMNARA